MKKIICIFGVASLSIIFILNLLFTANLNSAEHIEVSFNNFVYVFGVIFTGILIFFIIKIVNKYLYSESGDKSKKKLRKYIFISAFAIYILFILQRIYM